MLLDNCGHHKKDWDNKASEIEVNHPVRDPVRDFSDVAWRAPKN